MPTTPNLALVTPAPGALNWGTSGGLDALAARLDTLLTKRGAGAPATAPDFIPQLYYDTTNGIAYLATGTVSAANWIPLGQVLGVTIEGAPVRNGFRNAAWNLWRLRGGKTSWAAADLNAGARTFFADGWTVTSGGSALANVSQNLIGLYGGGFADASSKQCAVLAGGSATTDVDVAQRLSSLRTWAFRGRGATFVFRVFNGSGAAFTPSLILSTPSGGVDNWSSSADVATIPLQSCANGAWTAVGAAITQPTFDGYSNIANGFQARIRIPSGSLTTGKTVCLAQMLMDPGNVLRTFDAIPRTLDEQICDEYFHPVLSEAVNDSIAMGGWHSATGIHFYAHLPFRTPMRAIPTVSFDASANFKVLSGSSTFTPSAMAASQLTRMGALVRATTSAATIGAGGYLAWAAGGSYIDFSAEL